MQFETEWYRERITKVANAYALDPYLVEAVIMVESRGRADAFRYEPLFWERYKLAEKPEYQGMNPRRVSSSYGLMQIMYPVAREMGFADEPEALFGVTTNLHWGCRKLRRLQTWAAGFGEASPIDQLTAALASYNGGTGGNKPGTQLRPVNYQYAQRVLATHTSLRA